MMTELGPGLRLRPMLRLRLKMMSESVGATKAEAKAIDDRRKQTKTDEEYRVSVDATLL